MIMHMKSAIQPSLFQAELSGPAAPARAGSQSTPGGSQSRMPSICIVAHFAYGAMSGGKGGHVGGVEWQTSLTARWLAQRGYAVSLLTWDEGFGRETMIDGVRVIAMCRRDAGIPGLRFFTPRWSSLTAAMALASADVYYQNCGEYVTGQVSLWCERNNRGFVYSVASNPDCDPELPAMKTRRERMLYCYGLRHADAVIVQTRWQKKSLAAGFGVQSCLIPMPAPGPSDAEFVAPSPPSAGQTRVLFVGRIVPLKRLEWLLDMAERMPAVRFDVAGAPEESSAYIDGLMSRAASLKNVHMLGRVERGRMAELYRGAHALVCTSEYEGFPNTFLEAFSHGVPVVSTVDPDGLIVERSMGGVGDSVESLTNVLRGLLDSRAAWQAASAAARQYYSQNHPVERVLPQFERVFRSAARRP